MYHHSNSGRYAQVKHMKVKHLVQLVTLVVLFTWFLYQLNSSHKARVRTLRRGTEDEVGDEMLITYDNFMLGVNLDESADVAREEFIDKKSVKKSRKELRQKDRAELEQMSAEGEIVSDMFLDDSGEGDADDRVKREEQGRRADREIEGIERRPVDTRKDSRGIAERVQGIEKIDNEKGDDVRGESDISERQRFRNSVVAARGDVSEDEKLEKSGKKSLNYLNKVIAEETSYRTAQKANMNGSDLLEQETRTASGDQGTDLGMDDVGEVRSSQPANDTQKGSTSKRSSEKPVISSLGAFELVKSSSGDLEEGRPNSPTIGVGEGFEASEKSVVEKQSNDTGKTFVRYPNEVSKDVKSDNDRILLPQAEAESHIGGDSENLLADDKLKLKSDLEASGR